MNPTNPPPPNANSQGRLDQAQPQAQPQSLSRAPTPTARQKPPASADLHRPPSSWPFESIQKRLNADVYVTSEHLVKAMAANLDALDMGLELWDRQDRLVLCNQRARRIYAGWQLRNPIGQPFAALMRQLLHQHLFPAAVGREEDWLAQRISTRGKCDGPELLELADGHWLNVFEARTPDGLLMAVQTDVTRLVHREKTLEATNHYLTQQSSTDSLTGLANRRCFDEALVTEWLRAARSVMPLSLLMVDIDHFKNFNDHYGHPAGDECLRRVAKALGRGVRRAGELVARYGGEEFVLLLPNADLAQAQETAQNCLELVDQQGIHHAASATAPRLTISIGVACALPDASLDPRMMVNAADAAMYRAKSDGRARYEIATQADWDIDKDTPRTRPAPLI